MTPIYRHTFDFAFTVQTTHENPDDVTARELRYALQMRAHVLSDAELLEACGYLESDESESLADAIAEAEAMARAKES